MKQEGVQLLVCRDACAGDCEVPGLCKGCNHCPK